MGSPMPRPRPRLCTAMTYSEARAAHDRHQQFAVTVARPRCGSIHGLAALKQI